MGLPDTGDFPSVTPSSFPEAEERAKLCLRSPLTLNGLPGLPHWALLSPLQDKAHIKGLLEDSPPTAPLTSRLAYMSSLLHAESSY